MTLFSEITKYRHEADELTDPKTLVWGVAPDTVCSICGDLFNKGEAVIVFDTLGLGNNPLIAHHYHPSCLDVLVAVVVQDMAKLVEEKGFVVGEYMAERQDRVKAAFDAVMFSGSVLRPHRQYKVET